MPEDENEEEGEEENRDDKPREDAAPQPRDPPIPDNLKDPEAKRIKEDRKMALEGKLPERKFVVKRIEPQKVRHPQYGFSVECYNQRRDWRGQYTEAEVEEFATKYFGGGHFQVISHSIDGKLIGRRTFANPGEPNMDNLLADCCTSEQIAKYREALTLPPDRNQPQAASANAPAGNSNDPMVLAQNEIKAMKAEVLIKAGQVEKEKAEFEIQEDRRQLTARKYGFRPPHSRSHNIEVEDDGHPPPRPFDDLDKPVTNRDRLYDAKVDAMKDQFNNQVSALKEQLAEIRSRPPAPKTNIAETVAALIAAAAPILTEVIKISAENQRAQAESQRELMKTILDSGKQSDKQTEMLMQALGLRDQRQSNSNKEILELIKLGSEMGGGNNSWVSEIGQALGDIAGGVAGAITSAKQQRALPPPMAQRPIPQTGPRPVPVGPPMMTARPMPNNPRAVPGQQVGNLAPVAPRPLPAPAMQAPQLAPEPPKDDSMTEEDMKKLAEKVLASALQESETKPATSQWVSLAYNGLPDDLLREIANATSQEKLVEVFQPYARFNLLMALWEKIKSDPSIETWLRAGFEQLQQMAREELGTGSEPEPEPVKDEATKPIESEGPADIKDAEDLQ